MAFEAGRRVIRAGLRRMRGPVKPGGDAYLDQTVLGLLKEETRLLKVDYNESIGVGCDG
jgi:hypothetical protein